MEYISKQIAVEELENLRQQYEMHDDCDELVARKCKNAVSALPAADVAPVVHGHWETEEEDWGFCAPLGRNLIHRKFTCSVCGYITGDQAEKFVCCPICTARMDGGQHETD